MMKTLLCIIGILCWSSPVLAAPPAWATPCKYQVEISVAWDANSEPDVAGYKLYWGLPEMPYNNFKNMDVGNETTGTVPLCPCQIYRITATAYDIYGNESGYADEITVRPGSPDINGDGDVDGSDLAEFCRHFGSAK